MKKVRVSVAFHRIRVTLLYDFGGVVRDGIYLNPSVFVTPDITEVDFNLLLKTYYDARIAYVGGGTLQKGAYQAAKKALMDALDVLAEYVDSIADGDENIILLSGFQPTKGFSSDKLKPAQADDIVLKRGATGVLLAECGKMDDATGYGCIVTAGAPLDANFVLDTDSGQIRLNRSGSPQDSNNAPIPITQGAIIDLNLNRKKEFKQLIPGVTYYFAFWVVNTQGVGSLSLPKGIMCA